MHELKFITATNRHNNVYNYFIKLIPSYKIKKIYAKIWPIRFITIMHKVGFSFKFCIHCCLEASFGSVVTSGSFF